MPLAESERGVTNPAGDLVAQAEQIVLGAMMTSPAAIDDVIERLALADFADPKHGSIFAAITANAAAGADTGPVAIATTLSKHKELHRVGGAPYLHTLIAGVPTVANASWYAGEVARFAQLRAARVDAARLAQAADTGDFDQVVATRSRLTETWAALPRTANATISMRNGAWLDAQEFPPLRYAVPELLPEGSSLLIGPPKIGKSWAVLDILLAVASGGRAFGAIPIDEARPVLYLALEDGDRRLQDRCRKLLRGEPIPANFNYMTRVPPGQVIDVIADWTDRCPDAAIVVLDTLGKVMPPAQPGESAYARDYRIGGRLKLLVDERPGLALLTNHHDRKADSGDFVDSVSGTHGLAGAADTIILLTRPRQEQEGTLKITGRDVAEGEYAVVLEEGIAWTVFGGSLAAAAERVHESHDEAKLSRRSDRSGEIVAAIEAAGSDGIRASELSGKFGKDVYKYLERLTKDQLIVKASRGLYVRVRSVRTSDSQLSTGTGESDTSQAVSERMSEPRTRHGQGKRHSDTSDTPIDLWESGAGDPPDEHR